MKKIRVTDQKSAGVVKASKSLQEKTLEELNRPEPVNAAEILKKNTIEKGKAVSDGEKGIG